MNRSIGTLAALLLALAASGCANLQDVEKAFGPEAQVLTQSQADGSYLIKAVGKNEFAIQKKVNRAAQSACFKKGMKVSDLVREPVADGASAEATNQAPWLFRFRCVDY